MPALQGPSSQSAAGVALLGALLSPGLHSSLPELLTSFSGFRQVIYQPEPAHTVWKHLSPLLPWPPLLSAELLSASRLACPLLLISRGQFTIYSCPFEDFALSYRDLLHKLRSPLHKCLICCVSKPPSSPSNAWHVLVPPSRLCMDCCDPNILLFRNPPILSYSSNLMSHLPPFPE